MPDTSKKRVLVVGGARGIGETVSRLFAGRGWRVTIADRDVSRFDELGATGMTCRPLDVTSEEEVDALAVAMRGEDGVPDALVVTAAIVTPMMRPQDLPMVEWERVMDVNVRGTYMCCRAFGPLMADARRGSIVLLSSVAGLQSTPHHAYGPSKAAIVSLTQNLAGEWARFGIRVNAVTPSSTATPLMQALFDQGLRDQVKIAEGHALGRLVQPEEVAKAVHFLASDEASAVTGINLVVDAGALVGRAWASYGGVPRPPER